MALLRIREVEALGDFRLKLTLSDGSVIERDVSRLLVGQSSNPFAEIYRSLQRCVPRAKL
jgi:hypothetical protein